MQLAFRSPVTKPLLRKGTPKPVPPDPRAYESFRVTQQFSDPDFYHKDGRLHNATDIGNFRCGDPIVAMASGNASRVSDSAGALGIRIDHGYGVTSEYWHLNRQDASGPVKAGAQIGIVGSTGLGSVCHCHIEVKRDGTRIDPEPLMFGGSLTIEEDDVALPMEAGYFVTGVIPAGSRLRIDNRTTEGSEVTETDTRVQLLGIIRGGAAYTLGTVTDSDWYVVATLDGNVRQAAKLLVRDIEPTRWLFSQVPLPVADCSALENQIAGARTAVNGAAQALGAAQRSLA